MCACGVCVRVTAPMARALANNSCKSQSGCGWPKGRLETRYLIYIRFFLVYVGSVIFINFILYISVACNSLGSCAIGPVLLQGTWALHIYLRSWMWVGLDMGDSDDGKLLLLEVLQKWPTWWARTRTRRSQETANKMQRGRHRSIIKVPGAGAGVLARRSEGTNHGPPSPGDTEERLHLKPALWRISFPL